VDHKLKKQAAEAIILLQNENGEIKRELDHFKVAKELCFKFYKQGSVSAENLESLFDKLLSKTDGDLVVLEKAAELNIDRGDIPFGVLSDRFQDDGTLDPLTRCLLEDY